MFNDKKADTYYKKGREALKDERFPEAWDYFSKAYENGNIKAAYNMAVMAEYDLIRSENNLRIALDLYKMVQQKAPSHEENLEKRIRTIKNRLEAEDTEWKTESIRKNRSLRFIKRNAALLEEKGDYREAFIYFKAGAEEGDPDCQFSLAWCYYIGQGTEINWEKAVKWFEKSAEKGMDSYYYIARIYNVCGTGSYSAKAHKLYEAMYEMGSMDEHRILECARDYNSDSSANFNPEEALKWYERAIELGYRLPEADWYRVVQLRKRYSHT